MSDKKTNYRDNNQKVQQMQAQPGVKNAGLVQGAAKGGNPNFIKGKNAAAYDRSQGDHSSK